MTKKDKTAATPRSTEGAAVITKGGRGKSLFTPLIGLRLTVVLHSAEEGGFWAEVPALRGCVSEGDTLDEVVANVREAAQAWLEAAAELNPPESDPAAIVMELPL